MRMTHWWLSLLIAAATLADEPIAKPLQLDQVKQLTTDNGCIILDNILPMLVGDLVRIRLANGKELLGRIYQREEAFKEYVKILGEILNADERSNFGIIITYQGSIGGAVLFHESNKQYSLKFNQTTQAFMFELENLKPKDVI